MNKRTEVNNSVGNLDKIIKCSSQYNYYWTQNNYMSSEQLCQRQRIVFSYRKLDTEAEWAVTNVRQRRTQQYHILQ